MAINKRKVLDAARKHAQKGAKQKALKEYNKLVQADPRDAKVLLEIGDAYRRWGQAEEAIAQYTKVANQYKQDGFDARAVAVLKQILNLDPKRYTAHVALAELYQRMGLDSDAVGALRTAADGYYRDGRRKEALELLRRMAALDPSNTTSRLKVADLLRQEGMEDDAVNEYEEVVEELRMQGAAEQICVVQERILEIRPDHVATLTGLARNLNDLGRPERAEPFAVRALEHAQEPDLFELLAGIYKSLGNDAKLAQVTRDLAAYHRGRGDEDKAREVLQRLPPDSVLEGGPTLGDDRSEFGDADLDDAELGDDELLDDEDFLVTDASDESEVEPAVDTGAAAPADVSEDDLPEGDPEQLLAEASVYLRYGKRTQAIASLRSAIRQEPRHRGALEKLGDAYAEEDRPDEAIECWRQAIEVARADGDAQGFGVLRDRIAVLDPDAAAGIEPMQDPGGVDEEVGLDEGLDVGLDEEAGDEGGDAGDIDFDVDVELSDAGGTGAAETTEPDAGDLDLDLDVEMGGAADEAPEHDAVAFDADAADDGGIEIDLDIGDDGDALGEAEADAPAADADHEIEIDLDDAADELAAESEAGAGASRSGGGTSTTTAAQIQSDLEEADFYLEQGMDDEAEGIFRRILEVAPNHPTALLKLGELAARRGDDPGDVSDDGLDAAMAGASAGKGPVADASIDDAFDLDDEPGPVGDDAETGADASLSEDLAAVLAEAEASVDARAGAGRATPEVGDDATDEETERHVAPPEDDAGAIGDLLGDDATEVETVADGGSTASPFPPEPVQAEPFGTDDTLPITDDAPGDARATDSGAGADATFDLAAELADVFEDDGDEADPNAASGRSTVEEGFESLFASFKKGVSATLDEGDYDTRFDLGIAYREMGLFDDAISEFAVCLDSPTRRTESLHMMALCALELGRATDAVSHLEQALSSGQLEGAHLAALQLDLGRAHRIAGDPDAARAALDAVRGLDAGFPGLAEELAALESGDTSTGTADDGWESFDDLMGDDESAVEAEPIAAEVTETFESFDDVITEVEAETPAPVAEPAPTPAPDDDPPTDPGASRSGRKKKRISFV